MYYCYHYRCGALTLPQLFHYFLFSHFKNAQFCINLPTVLQCLSLLGSLECMKLTLSYNLTQEVFQLELTDDAGVLSTASLSGLQPPEDDDMTSLALAMRSSSIHARVIFQSECLRDVLVELDTVGGAKVGTVSLNATSLDIAVVGDLSECLVSIPCKGDHVVSMECPPEASPHSFPLHSLLGSFRGLEIAHETCITVSKNGMMAIQHQVIDTVVGNGTPSFVDFVRISLFVRVRDPQLPLHFESINNFAHQCHLSIFLSNACILCFRQIMCCLDETDDSSTVTPPPSETATRHSPSTYHHPPPPTVDNFSQSVATATSLLDDHSRVRGSSSTTVWHHGSDHDTTTDEDEPPDMSSAAPLFGSVVRSKTTGHKNEGPTMRRRQRRRMHASSNERRHHRSTRDNRGTSGTTSDHDSDNDEDAEMQELDVSARRQTTTTTAYNEGRDRGNTSSPELVYGRQE